MGEVIIAYQEELPPTIYARELALLKPYDLRI